MAIGTGLALLGSALIGGVASTVSTRRQIRGQQQQTAANQTAANTAISNNNAAVQQATSLITGAHGTARAATDQAANNLGAWRQVGLSALASLASVHGFQLPDELKALAPGGAMGGFFESPEYKFRVEQGSKAITGNAAARGLLDSGATGKALVRFGQEEASKEFSRWYDRLAGVANLGFEATNATNRALISGAEVDLNYAQTIGDLTVNNANRNGLITLGQGQLAGQSAVNQGNLTGGLIANLGGIGAGLIQNWPTQQRAQTLPQMGVTSSDYMGNPGLINRDWRAAA